MSRDLGSEDKNACGEIPRAERSGKGKEQQGQTF